MDFFERQEAARNKTKLLVVYFILAVILIIVTLNLIAFFALKASATDQQLQLSSWFSNKGFYLVTGFTVAMICLGSLYRWFQMRGGGKSLAQMVGAREVLPDTNDRLERRLINVIEEMSIASGMSVPTIYIMDEEEAINAFVAGLEASDTIMVVTRGALEQLNRQELQGVVAHEFSHIFNADMRINIKLISILAGILLIGQAGYFIMRSLRHGRIRSNNNKGGGLIAAVVIVGLSMYIIGSIGLFFGRLIKASISRQREFLADASAIQYARDNVGLANAFIKIGQQSSLLQNSHAEEASHMCIAKPIRLSFNGLSTHPPLEQRLDAIMPDWRQHKEQLDKKIIRQDRYKAQEQAIDSNQEKGDKNPFSGLVESVGKPTAKHTQAANMLLLSVPEVLKSAAHNHHATTHAIHLVFALLLSDDGKIQIECITLIEQAYGNNSSKQILQLSEHISKEKKHLRLTLLDLAIPSIRRLSDTERAQFFTLLKKIIHLDNNISQFEYVIYSLLKKNLTRSRNKSRKRIMRFSSVTQDIQLILSAVVHASGRNSKHKEQLFRNLMVGFSEKNLPLLENTFKAEEFNNSLMQLNQLSPMLKKPFLTACEEAIKEDNIMQAEEIELLRAIAEYLDCPMPILISK